MTTHDAITTLTKYIKSNDLIICSLGRTAEETFLNVDDVNRVLFLDCMGAVTGTAIGISLGCPKNDVFAFETDGSLMYNLSIFHTLSHQKDALKNLKVVIFDNEILESGGGIASRLVDFDWKKYADSWGVDLFIMKTKDDLNNYFINQQKNNMSVLLIKINNQNIPQTCFKDIDGIESRYRFKRFICNNINPNIIKPAIKN